MKGPLEIHREEVSPPQCPFLGTAPPHAQQQWEGSQVHLEPAEVEGPLLGAQTEGRGKLALPKRLISECSHILEFLVPSRF